MSRVIKSRTEKRSKDAYDEKDEKEVRENGARCAVDLRRSQRSEQRRPDKQGRRRRASAECGYRPLL